jgi:hypothetical protein
MFKILFSMPRYCRSTDAILGSSTWTSEMTYYNLAYAEYLANHFNDGMDGEGDASVIHVATGRKLQDLVPFAPDSSPFVWDSTCPF